MAPSTTCIVNQLRQHVYYHIDNNLLKNALFLAERLVACDIRSPESAYLLSLCHLRLGDYKSAYEYSKQHGSRGTHLGCAYIFAQASLALERYKDGIVALDKSRGLWGGRNNLGKHTQTSRQPYPDAAAILCLLGKLHRCYDKKKAVNYYEEALKLNPFMWDAFTDLCDMGARVQVPNIFKANPEMEATLRANPQQLEILNIMATKDSAYGPVENSQNRSLTRVAPAMPGNVDPFNNAPSRGFGGGLFGTIGLSQKINESIPATGGMPAAGGGGIGPEAMETPTGPSATIDASVVTGGREPGIISAFTLEPPQAPLRRNRTLQGLGMDFGIDAPKMSRAVSKRSLKTDASSDEVGAPVRPSAVTNAGGERKRTVSGQVVQPRNSQPVDPGAPQRRSVRLFNQIRPSSSRTTTATSTNGNSQGRELKKTKPPLSKATKPGSGTSTVGRIVSGNREPRRQAEDGMDVDAKDYRSHGFPNLNGHAPARTSEQELIKMQEDAMKWLLELFKKLAAGYSALSQFQCSEAILIYSSLPSAQQNTPWVLAQIGRAYFEQAAYGDAETYFRKIRALAPTRFADMEIYSTILWHLKREIDLSFLAHELVDADWLSPQAWCALGNAWSMTRDHEQALRCFKRATQLNSKFAYAFTLQGHEHVANEEYDKALGAYRQGMAADNRHYNAYYGVGRVYEKLGQYEKAFKHFAAAARINPTNAVLICCIGTVLEKQKRSHEALQYFSRATELAPRSALTRFKKSRALMATGELHAALQELMILKDIAPDEAMVHFLLGRLYKNLHDKGAAVRHFTIALNLDPKVCVLLIVVHFFNQPMLISTSRRANKSKKP